MCNKIFFTLTAVTGVIAISWTLSTVPLEATTLWFGLAALGLLLVGPFLLGLVLALRRSALISTLDVRLENFLARPERFTQTMTTLAFLGGLGLVLILAIPSPLFQDYATYYPIFEYSLGTFETIRTVLEYALPLLVWGVGLLWGCAVWLYRTYRRPLEGAIGWKMLFTLAVLTATGLHWFILVMQAQVFTRIPGYYWEIAAKPFTPRDLVFPVMLGLALIVVAVILRNPHKTFRNLVIIYLFGWLLQFSFGVIEGQGLESLRLKFATSWHKSQAMNAAKDDFNLIEIVTEYNQIYGERMFNGSKPPGTIVFYKSMQYLADWLNSQDTVEGRFLALTTLLAFVLPCLAFLIVFLIQKFSNQISDQPDNLYPSLLYISLPNVILLPLFLDQALFPLLFMLGAAAIIFSVKRQSFWWAVASGVVVYLLAFTTFALLTAGAFVGIYLLVDFWINRKRKYLVTSLKLGSGVLLGVALALVVGCIFLNYNPLIRYQKAMEITRNYDFIERIDAGKSIKIENTGFLIAPELVLEAMLLNNTEFAAAIGFPVTALFLVSAGRTLSRFGRGKATRTDAILIAFLLTFVALNLFAPIRGEAARLWLFFAPMFVLFAGLEIPRLFDRDKRVVYGLIVLQLITIFLTYKFQDLAP